MKKIVLFLAVIVVLTAVLLLPVFGSEEGTVLCVTPDGEEIVSNTPLADWADGNYCYIKLIGNTELTLNGESIIIDLAGNDLVLSGNGTISAFDSANDSFRADSCGKLYATDGVVITNQISAPNGNTYVAISADGYTTFHRMQMELSYVTLRTTKAGLYYKATYHCDPVLSKEVKRFGIALSLYNMPGADFTTEPEYGNHNRWTVSDKVFQSGITITSGSVFNILDAKRSAAKNNLYGKWKIYANPYVDVGNGVVVADTKNAGKVASDESFTGTAVSLYDVMNTLDSIYSRYSASTQLQLDAFYAQWKKIGIDWKFVNIGTADSVVNDDLQFVDDTYEALCPACNEMVTWKPVDQQTYGASGYGIVQQNGEHICLIEDIVYSGSDYFIGAPGSSKTACFHLNGHSITAKQSRVIAGSSGVLNVMGNGTVLGNYMNASSSFLGATVNINTNGPLGTLNLYGGTYGAADGNTQDTVISLYNNGGKLRIMEGAKVISDGYAIKVGTANLVPAELTIRGTVAGKVKVAGADISKGQSSTFNLDGGRIDGGVEIGLNNLVNISGAPVVGGSGMQLEKGLIVTLGALFDGANLPVLAEGTFAEVDGDASSCAEYFTSLDPLTKIVPMGSVLCSQKDYASDLRFAEDGKTAFCPVCEKDVVWTALTQTGITIVKDKHYYLTTDINHTNSSAYLTGPTTSGGTICLHLNGHNITATQYRAINVANAKLNLMGTGVISGNKKDQNLGAVIYSGYTSGQLHIYSGTVKRADGNQSPTIVAKKGALALYEGACVEGGIVSTVGVQLHGAKITGTLDITDGTVQMSGAPKVELLKLATGMKIELLNLAKGTDITVEATGTFTTAHPQCNRYLAYFTSADANKPLEVLGNALAVMADPSEDDTLYILTAAASNSHYFMDELYGVLAAAGVKAKVCNLMKSSTGINDFYNYWKNGEKVFQLIIHDENGTTVIENMGLDDALSYYNWDVFNMQEGTAPHRTTTPEQAAADRQVAHEALVAHIRKTIPLAKLYYQEIWSPDIGFDRFNYQMTTKEQQLDFSARIKTYTNIVCEEFDLDTIPSGSAWVIARESELLQNMCARLSVNNGEGDYYHDGDIGGGQYLNACVWFETLTGQSCIGNTFRPDYDLSEEKIALLQQAAHQAVADLRAAQ